MKNVLKNTIRKKINLSRKKLIEQPLKILKKINNEETKQCAIAERSLLKTLGGDLTVCFKFNEIYSDITLEGPVKLVFKGEISF